MLKHNGTVGQLIPIASQWDYCHSSASTKLKGNKQYIRFITAGFLATVTSTGITCVVIKIDGILVNVHKAGTGTVSF